MCTPDTLTQLRRDYKIPDSITLSLSHQGYDVYTPPWDRLLIHKAAFECGVRLPLLPTLCQALIALELDLSDLAEVLEALDRVLSALEGVM